VNGPTLTAEEQRHTLAALHFLRTRLGNWKLLAKALGFEHCRCDSVKENGASTDYAPAVTGCQI